MMYEKWFSQDLRENVSVRHCESVVFEGDSNTYKVGVAITDGGADVTLTGTVSCKVIRPDGATVTFAGDKEGGRLWAVLNKSSLSYAGQIAVVLQLTNTVNEVTETITLLKAIFSNELTTTDTIVDPGNVIPSLEELLAQIDTMNQGTARANAAAAALEDMTVEAHAVTNNTPTAAITETGGHYNIDFGLVPATISSQASQYQVSTSGTTVPTGTWLDAVPTVPQGQFLWTRTTINWNGGQQTLIYSVSRQGIDGSGAVSTVNGISPDANGEVTLPVDTVPASGSSNLITSGAVYTVDQKTVTNAGAISGLATRMGTAEDDIDALETAAGTMDESISNLGTQVNNLAAAVEAGSPVEQVTGLSVTKSSGSISATVSSEAYRCGNVIMLQATMTTSASISGGNTVGVLSVEGIPLPVIGARAAMYFGNSVIIGNLTSSGTLTVANTGASLASGKAFMLTFTYIGAPEEEPEPEEET